MKILMVAPEVYPYAKVGGLADVISGLSNALYNLGHDVRIICPMYSDVPEEQFQCITKPMVVHLGKEDQECNVVEFQLSGSSASVYLLENDRYYKGRRVYEFERNIDFEPYEPYVFLSRGSIDFCYQFEWIPDVIHCHDWMTSLVPIYIKYNEVNKPLG